MPCYRPLKGYRSRIINPDTRKRSIVFNPREGLYDLPLTFNCGSCIGCRLERSRQWAMRCVHEASLHEKNCFITLTYAPEHLPEGETLVFKHFQDFMKRLRKKYGEGIRFFHCGEYGEKKFRPHYHALLFNFDFPDRETAPANLNKHSDHDLYVSNSLTELWGKGICTVGDVTFESAAYVARYITKKITGELAETFYENIDYETGEIFDRKPEYITMSRRPGIGKGWYDQWKTDVYPSDSVVIRGKEMKPPKFYDKQIELDDPKLFRSVKRKRKHEGEKKEEPCPSRLSVREKHKTLVTKTKLLRKYEQND